MLCGRRSPADGPLLILPGSRSRVGAGALKLALSRWCSPSDRLMLSSWPSRAGALKLAQSGFWAGALDLALSGLRSKTGWCSPGDALRMTLSGCALGLAPSNSRSRAHALTLALLGSRSQARTKSLTLCGSRSRAGALGLALSSSPTPADLGWRSRAGALKLKLPRWRSPAGVLDKRPGAGALDPAYSGWLLSDWRLWAGALKLALSH